ncbi:hypothetical protein ACH4UM_18880 [Streptomyces sp. NPDC020801]|uniref:hypothetical protein n=1 Tax=Streptomyces sp. NPDC020801 TaxID=3365093 RepID=UPI0037A0F181
MGLLDRLLGNDHQRAATKYAGRESATDRAARQRRENHRRRGIAKAARQAEKWEQQDRRRFR